MKWSPWILLVVATSVMAQEKTPDPWQDWKYFVGAWEGTSSGQSGDGKVERSYGFVLGERYLEVRNRVVYAPQEGNPEGEVHEDIGYISFDKGRKKNVLRQFHGEGFVNQYVRDSSSASDTVIVFTAEAIENIAAGWRARESYRLISDNEFEEVFELAEPGGEFEMYSKSVLKRKR